MAATRFYKTTYRGGQLTHLESEFLFDISLTLQAPLDIGPGPEGHRLIVMTSGGRFQGPRLSGTVLPLTGADWVGVGRIGRGGAEYRVHRVL
jgi:Protein of unknown function (DUF3237)